MRLGEVKMREGERKEGGKEVIPGTRKRRGRDMKSD